MNTEIYNKQHILNQELKRLEETEKLLKIANELVKIELQTFTETNEQLSTTQEIMTSSLKKYLRDIQEIRMSYGREVIHLIESSRELNQITKGTEAIGKACDALVKLGDVLNQDLIVKIKRVFNIEGDKL